MGNVRGLSAVQRELIREIVKHPKGTMPGVIYKNFDAQTWEILKRADRINGVTNGGAIFQMLMSLAKDPSIYDQEVEIQEKVEAKQEPVPIIKVQDELDFIIEEAILSFNSEIQKAIEDISLKVFDEVKNKINDLED
ncbi:hypothetical protein ACWV26_08455 [Rummeliibacillus sp. JY-2-4R]